MHLETDFIQTVWDNEAKNAIEYVIEVEPSDYYLHLTAFNSTNESGFSEDVIPIHINPIDTIVPSTPQRIILILKGSLSMWYVVESEVGL